MSTALQQEDLRRLQAEVRFVAEHVRLALPQPRGFAGEHLGRGVGASVEIHDHRPFVLGDDPRHLDWNAYARTGQWIARTFRPEVMPRVDLAVDDSPSMWAYPAKQTRALQLFYLLRESARGAGASVRVHTVRADVVRSHELQAVDHGSWWTPEDTPQTRAAPSLGRVPWRQGALRIWLSDLLYPAEPRDSLAPLVRGAGRAVVLVPFAREEAAPQWQGNLTLVDAESQQRRVQFMEPDVLARYSEAYARHFEAYARMGPSLGVPVARVSCEGDLRAALNAQALPMGVFVA